MTIVDQLKDAGNTGEPDDGIYQARVERCKIVTIKSGAEMIVTEFTTDPLSVKLASLFDRDGEICDGAVLAKTAHKAKTSRIHAPLPQPGGRT